MRKSFHKVLRYVTPALILVMLIGCGLQPTQPAAPQTVVPPSKTPKPTFTPLAQPTPVVATPVAVATPAPTTGAKAQPSPQAPTGAAATAPPKAASPTPPPPTQAPTAAPKQSIRMNSPEYGMQAFLWWRPEVGSRDLQALRDAGFGWCKVNFGWRDIEGAGKGIYDWSHTDWIVETANREKIDLLVRIDHQPAWSDAQGTRITGGGFPVNGPPDNLQDLADFLTALVSRYKGRIRAYEVWNEPNLAREWGGKLPDPGAYVKLLKVAYQAIKAADPKAMVISAGLTPTGSWTNESRPDDWYLESMYIAMGNQSEGYFDVLGVHGAGYKSPPERDPAEVAASKDLGGHRSFCFRRIEDLRAIMVKYGDSAKQVAVLEFGWSSDPRPDSPYNWHMVSEEVKADYFVRAYRYARQHWSPWIGLMSLIYISDPDWTEQNEQYWWAITYPGYPQFKPRPAYTALKAMPK